MIKLYDQATDAEIGTITDAQLGFLIDQLEEEFREDQDYYITRDTVEMLRAAGADPALLELFELALGDRQDLEFRWERID